jgi:hypothetical protein
LSEIDNMANVWRDLGVSSRGVAGERLVDAAKSSVYMFRRQGAPVPHYVSKQSAAGDAGTSGKKAVRAKRAAARAPAPQETIEARLDRKAAVADSQGLATKSLGRMSRAERHKLLYRD